MRPTTTEVDFSVEVRVAHEKSRLYSVPKLCYESNLVQIENLILKIIHKRRS